MFRNAFEPWHLILIVAVLVLVFGSKKLPDMARGLGRSMRILKSEAKALKDDRPAAEPQPEAAAAAQPPHPRPESTPTH
ncbi:MULTISPECIES: Sec-independent protein translocase subunit TatA [Streptomyces]|uniref:Sec-independent protein translocase protein TatA n=1 Tax=Streptomyces celluloflavus TaxID=58344 RepID=A0ABW7RNL9_9ACTN|nr:Sec-independent protein translocase subunit TatA [Streptomyces kasugaensis]MYU53029.1 twin-arginine translocase TatA/TatE family subunit [Streptomyces sp. SID7805]WSK13354.1 Sec-independent protein translocase subunit TatA [Streptomyces celluloflavus]